MLIQLSYRSHTAGVTTLEDLVQIVEQGWQCADRVYNRSQLLCDGNGLLDIEPSKVHEAGTPRGPGAVGAGQAVHQNIVASR